MKKRVVSLLLCLIMALSLIPTAAFATDDVPDANNTPDVQAATDEVAVQGWGDNNKPQALGWKYATITSNRNGGYTCTPATKPTDATITVKVGDTELATAGNKYNWVWDNIDSNRSTPVTVTVSEGYYISAIVFCCNDTHYSYGEGFNCQTSKTEQAYKQGGKLTDSSVTMTLGELWDTTPHRRGNQASPYNQCYWLMIMVAKCPDPVFVGYDVGTADGVDFTGIAPVEKSTPTDKGTWIDGTYNMRYENFDNDTPEHTALGISAAAAKKAAEKGYVFDGWSVVRYDEYDQVNNTFNKASTTDSAHANAKDSVTLFTHTKLVAQWKEAPKPITGSLTIEKKVEGLTGTDIPASFSFTVTGPNYSNNVTVSATDGWKTTLSDLTPGEYTVTENNSKVPGGYELNTTYVPENRTVTVNAGAIANVTVTNTYTKTGPTEIDNTPATITITKVDKDNNNTKLTGAVFQLRDKDNNVYGTFAEDGNGVYTISNITVEKDTRLYLYETTAPAGYVTPTGAVAEFDAILQTYRTVWKSTATNPTGAWVTVGDTMIRKIGVQQFDFGCTIEITNDKLFSDVDVVNPSKLTVEKKDARTEENLDGATFQLLKKDVNGDYQPVANYGTTSTGTVEFIGLGLGEYQLKETKAPDGYVGWTDRVFAFSVKKNADPTDAAHYNEATKKFEKVFDSHIEFVGDAEEVMVKGDGSIAFQNYRFANNTLTIFNEKLETVTINVKKVVEAPYASAPANAEFKFFVTLVPCDENNAFQYGDSVLSALSVSFNGKPLAFDEENELYYFTMKAGEGTLTLTGTRNDLDALHVIVSEDDSEVPANWTYAEDPCGAHIAYSTKIKGYTFITDDGDPVSVPFTFTNTYTKIDSVTAKFDVEKVVERQRGSRKPGKADFTFEAYYTDANGKLVKIDQTLTISTNGVDKYTSSWNLVVPAAAFNDNGYAFLTIKEVNSKKTGWTYDKTEYKLVVTQDGKVARLANPLATAEVDPDAALTLSFTNTYYKRSGGGGGGDKPIQSVKTGDMGIAMYAMTSLLSLGGAALVIKKRKEEK